MEKNFQMVIAFTSSTLVCGGVGWRRGESSSGSRDHCRDGSRDQWGMRHVIIVWCGMGQWGMGRVRVGGESRGHCLVGNLRLVVCGGIFLSAEDTASVGKASVGLWIRRYGGVSGS